MDPPPRWSALTVTGRPRIHRLVLWNIDLTLVNVARVTRAAYADAFRAVAGRPLVQLPQMAGRTDSEIFFDLFALNDDPGMAGQGGEELLSRFLEELAAAFASADAFLFPSTTETLGIAMIEALASGLPVLAARAGASAEVVSDGETGILYDPDSDASLVAAVRRLVSDDGLRARMGRSARTAAEGRDWASSTRTLRGYYETALGEG